MANCGENRVQSIGNEKKQQQQQQQSKNNNRKQKQNQWGLLLFSPSLLFALACFLSFFARIRMCSEKSNVNHMSWYRISASFSAYEFINGCGASPQRLHAHVWKHNERPEPQVKKVVAASL